MTHEAEAIASQAICNDVSHQRWNKINCQLCAFSQKWVEVKHTVFMKRFPMPLCKQLHKLRKIQDKKP